MSWSSEGTSTLRDVATFDTGQTESSGLASLLFLHPQSSSVIALFHYAAEALIQKLLDGRTLPEPTRSAAVSMVRTRLMQGWLPVIDGALRARLDEAATRADVASEGVPIQLAAATVRESPGARPRHSVRGR
jgi:hypothetical protein